MGKRLRKHDLLNEIRIERDALDELLARVRPSDMTRAGVTRGGWSVKDVLAHIVDWQERNLRWHDAGLRGETPELPEPGMTWRELPRLNAQIYRKHHHRPLDEILDDYVTLHDRMIALIARVREADLVALGRYSWTGPSWTLSDYIRANTAAHYRWARTRIRRWLLARAGARIRGRPTPAPARIAGRRGTRTRFPSARTAASGR